MNDREERRREDSPMPSGPPMPPRRPVHRPLPISADELAAHRRRWNPVAIAGFALFGMLLFKHRDDIGLAVEGLIDALPGAPTTHQGVATLKLALLVAGLVAFALIVTRGQRR